MTTIDPRTVVLGLEFEAYTIRLKDHAISRQMAFPRRGVSERGERFARDTTIGTEYNSQPFATVREGLFLVRAGLRKYGQRRYRSRTPEHRGHELFLVGGWRDRFAGAHLHLSLADRMLDKELAKKLAWHLHDHLPFLIAIGANSPVWADQITSVASNRVARASGKYFHPIERGQLFQRNYDEMLYSRGRKLKPATIEIRVLDSNIPEYVLAAGCAVKAVVLNWLEGNAASNRISKADYLQSRQDAAERGMRAKLCWRGKWVTVPRYLDLFVWAHRDYLWDMDIPEEVWLAFQLLKRRINGATLIERAARLAHDEHPQTWQRRFAKRYVAALDQLLSGNTLYEFAEQLGVDVPDVDEVWIGRRNLDLT